jgi:membrane-bound ClpP family serine protease
MTTQPPPAAPPPPDPDDPTGRITRLGPESGGRVPGDGAPRVEAWSWTTQTDARVGVPVLGIVLVVLGLLFLLQQLVPGTSFWAWAALALGGVGVAVWVFDHRRTGMLQVGLVLVAAGIASPLQALGLISGDGWWTLFVGLTLVAIGVARRSGGIPWQVWIGGLLALIGASQTVLQGVGGGWVFPAAVIAVGALLILRATRRSGS